MKALCLLPMFLVGCLATSVYAETINCTPITALPVTITVQGIYCLTGNLSTSQSSGYAITINANNVTIDLNAWKLGGQGAGTGTSALGIYSTADNVTIKNGIVRGFEIGIVLQGSGAVVQDMLVDENTYIGIHVIGLGALVEHNQVVDTGGSTLNSYINAIGIMSEGLDSTVTDNMVSGLTVMGADSGNQEYGILSTGSNSTIRNNVVSNTTLPTTGGDSYGINTYQDIVLNNTVSEFVYGIYNDAGIYAYNTANNCTTSFFGTGGAIAGSGNSP